LIYKRDGLVFTTLKDPHWGNPKIARIMPVKGESWGSFKEIEGTQWEGLIPSISEKVLERALLGDTTPLMREVRSPEGCLSLAPINKICSSFKTCASAHKIYCHLHHKKMSECFSVEGTESHRILISAWKENFHVIRIK